MKIDSTLTAKKLLPKVHRLFELSARKILSLEKTWNPERGTPVFTVHGRYTTRGWTEWTQGFQFGSAILQFDATGEERFLDLGRSRTVELMASHVSHMGVHDHGFNNVSTYGNLLRLMREGRIAYNVKEKDFYELALKVSGAVQAARWTTLADGTGFIHSFNGPHSLFVDTIRSCRSLALAHGLGHALMGEQDERISLLERLIDHALNTARYSIYYGDGRDAYDIRGRTAHEAVFNIHNGVFRCPNSQQGYSPFSTWTRGLAWAILGFAEQLEFFQSVGNVLADNQPAQAKSSGKRTRPNRPYAPGKIRAWMLDAARATADFYIDHACADGIPLWDTGAPNLHRLGDYRRRPANPWNACEPVDSSAAAIAAQGLIRLGNTLRSQSDAAQSTRYRQAGFTIASTLFDEPYLATQSTHQGLILHSIYHRPNGWDYVAPKQKIPNGESSMWGDYHARELAQLLLREATDDTYPAFYGCI